MADMVVITLGSVIEEPDERKPVAVEYWYDRHFWHWVIYPVDAEGNQMCEARYGFSKKEALEIKADFEADIANGVNCGWYY